MRTAATTGTMVAVGALIASSLGCGSSGSGTGTASGGSAGGGGTNVGGSSGSGGGKGGVGGVGGAGGGTGATGNGGGTSYCPSADLGSSAPVTYKGTTVGKANLVTSARLEWKEAGDEALLFTAGSAGTYRFSMPVGEGGCGASIREFGPNQDGMGTIYDPSWCPSAGQSVEIDGVFAAIPPNTTTDVALTAGQKVLIWVSCSYWSNPVEAPYQLTIEKI